MSDPRETSLLPPPAVFGVPAKFSHWRGVQERGILAAMNSDRRFIFQAMPTGSGKSLCYVSHALISGARTCILTSTKGLQSQLVNDFGESGLVDIRGMNSYSCRAAESEFGMPSGRTHSCDDGPCKAGLRCTLRDSGCSYYDAYHTAQSAQLVVTNYMYWMTIHRYGEGLGPFDLLILDEGHDAPDELSSFLSIELDLFEIEGVMKARPMADGVGVDDWRKWAAHHAALLQSRLDTLSDMAKSKREDGGRVDHGTLREIRSIRLVLGKCKSLAESRGEWVFERTGKNKFQFDPIWPSQYAESILFRGTPKVVVFSATIRPKTAAILGLSPDDYDFNEYPSSFPPSRRPVVHVPTCQMSHRTSPEDQERWATRIDQIIRQRMDRKGIVHTVSFARRNLIFQHSEFRDIMYTNTSDNTRHVIEEFKRAKPPAVLVSPSVTTGWDFPFDECQFQIIGKIPFPDTRPLVTQARSQSDKDYAAYIAAQTLVQMAGRGMRDEMDVCETIVIDDNWKWFLWKYRHLFPGWFMEACKTSVTIPKPPMI